MKKTLALLAAGASIGAPLTQAATITWLSPQDITSSDDVVTDGDQVFGRNIGIATGSEVNGVKFGFAETYTLTYSESVAAFLATPISAPSYAGADGADLQAVLSTSRNLTAPGTMTFGNLTVGQEYLIQFFVADYRAFNDDLTVTLGTPDMGDTTVNAPTLKFLDADLSNGADASQGQFVIGTFIADDTDISLSLNDIASYNALQIRAIPEPSSTALLGLAGLTLLLRRRK